MRSPRHASRSGFTLIELMVVLAVIAVLLFIAAPSFREVLDVQRVRGVGDQFITDVQFARSEAAGRQEAVGISFRPPNATMTCYTIHTCGSRSFNTCTCDCTAAAGGRCPAPSVLEPDPPREIRTVQLALSGGVRLDPVLNNGNPVAASAATTHVSFDPATGGLSVSYPTGITVGPVPPNNQFWARSSSTVSGTATAIRHVVATTGRPSNCKPTGSTVKGLAPC